MSPETDLIEDVYDRQSEIQSVAFSPRIVLIHKNRVALVRYKDTKWFGLLGGKIKHNETQGNLLSTGAFPSLVREVLEEAGADIFSILGRVRTLGVAEICAVSDTKRTITEYLVPVFFCHLSDEDKNITNSLENNPDIHMLDFNNQGEVSIFPDARFALNAINRGRKTRKPEPTPMYLTDAAYYFRIEPKDQMGLLFGPPDWYRPQN